MFHVVQREGLLRKREGFYDGRQQNHSVYRIVRDNQAASKAYETTFGKTPIPQRSGGSIPIVALFEQELKSKTILMGFGLDSDAIHSPNEHFGVWNYLKGIETIPYFYLNFTKLYR